MNKTCRKILILCIGAMLVSFSSAGAQESFDTPFCMDKEIITYDIKNLGIPVGEAVLKTEGLQKIEGKDAFLIIFTAKALNFFDEEKIYVDPQTFLPIIILRDLNIFGKKETIREEYLPEKAQIKISKEVKDRTEEMILDKQGAIENIYGFIFRYRLEGKFEIGETLELSLPTKDVSIELLKETKMQVMGEKQDVYFLQSDPKQYRIWFEKNERKIPVRIDGSVGFGKTSMILKEYSVESH